MLRGEIVVGQLTMLSVERHYRDLQTAHKRGFYFSPAHAWHCIDFVQGWFVHTTGPLGGKPIVLDGWQLFWTANLIGWREIGSNLRRFRTGYEEVARKNGKSTWMAPIGTYLWMMDGESGAQVYTIATTRAQAMPVFKPAFANVKRWVRKSPRLAKSIKIFEGANQEKMVLFGEFGESVYEPLAANAESLDGKNPSVVLVDELHAHKTREVWEVMKSALGARLHPLINAITTAGFILDGICVEIRTYLVKVLRGEVIDDRMFGVIYTIDEGDDPYNPDTWVKANPSLGSAKTYTYMQEQASQAKVLPSARAGFLTKDLNVFVGDALSWFDMTVWDKGGKKFDRDMLKGRTCYGGLDLASTRDITAFVLLFPPPDGDEDGDWYVLAWCWVPEAKLKADASAQGGEKAKVDAGADYKTWSKKGWLTVTEGDVTDYGPVRKTILQAMEDYDVQEIAFDTWNSTHIANELLEKDAPMVKLPQNFGGLSPGAKHIERLVYSKRLRHAANPLLRWCAGNVTLLIDSNENIKPDKKRSQGRIDPVVAMCMAATRAMVHLDSENDQLFVPV